MWAALSKEQIQQMINRDATVCRFLKAPERGKSIDLPLLSADCVNAIPPEELIKLLLSPAVKAFPENPLNSSLLITQIW